MKKPVTARGIAARVLADVSQRGRSMDSALAAATSQPATRDGRAFAQALLYASLRAYHRHEVLLRELLHQQRRTDPLVLATLHLGLTQLEDERTPPHAAVAATVETSREVGRPRAAGLVNAVLRRYQREREALHKRCADKPAFIDSHPGWLRKRLQRDWPDDAAKIMAANNRHAPQWLRVNLAKTTREKCQAAFVEAGIESTPAADCATALCLTQAMQVSEIPGFDAGEVSVQDAAAQFAATLLDAQAGMRVLDACAAPGGKTCHLQERAGGELKLTAIDIDADRLTRIGDNLERLGLSAKVLAGDAAAPDDWWDGKAFERILLDAPCSSSGVIRRHPDIKLLRRESDIASLNTTQSRLLAACWRMLAPGGTLLYATCSVFTAENSLQVESFLGEHGDAQAIQLARPGRPRGPGRQILPGDADMDGFYYACLVKNP